MAMKPIGILLMTFLVLGCVHEYRNIGRLTGENFDGVVLRSVNAISISSWTPSTEDILTLEAMLPAEWESLRKVKRLRPLSEYKRYYLPKSHGPGDHRIDVWFFHQSVDFVQNGKWLNNDIDLRSKIGKASYDLGFDCNRHTFYVTVL